MPDFGRFLGYDELTRVLRDWEKRFPDLMRVVSAGKSFEGRDIWAAEVTDYTSGSPADKPAAYAEGNIHAGEVTGSQVCLYLLDHLLNGFGKDGRVTALLRERAYYILPRVNPDGAERYLTTPYTLRSSVRPYPEGGPADGDGNDDGLVPEDVDGDGRILQMRVEDPSGEWRVSRKDRRLMVRRAPADRLEEDGPFYRIMIEGVVPKPPADPLDHTYLRFPPPKQGLDTNRNWPANWQPEHVQEGAGPFPLSEPETRSVAGYMMARRNIATVMTFHTSGGQVIRPMSGRKDDELPKNDLALFDAVGRRGAELTGYDYLSVMEFSGGNFLFGDYQDWAYEHLGTLAYCTELWNMDQRAGIARRGHDVPGSPAEEERGLALLKWNDRDLLGQGFTPWRPFAHPQLGKVEIGGWDRKYVMQNPPAQYLLGECHRNATFLLDLAEATPLLRLRSCGARAVDGQGHGHDGGRFFIVTAEVENVGYLPTNVTEMGLRSGVARPPQATLTAGAGVTVVHPGPKRELSHLAGVGDRVNNISPWMQVSPENSSVVKVQWLLQVGAGQEPGRDGFDVEVEVRADKGGVCRARVRLE